MAETFYLSNIVPQNYENNAGFWNRWEVIYKRNKWKASGQNVVFIKLPHVQVF